ncbi:MAG: sodium:proton antiporter [Caldimicrobium sp.]|nr:sodium:proton antiporter [Caldimicrobium sp.]
MANSFGELLPIYTIIPFLGMLASIAIFPLLCPRIWHHHFGKITLFWATFGVLVILYYLRLEGVYLVFHVLLEEYLPFIILLSALYVVSCGIYVSNFLSGTPLTNTLYLAFGTPLASLMGTTGASMVLIGPFLRANAWRKKRDFMVVFYIFLVSNIGGSLTPLGDPPLFLGYLKGVPFFWTLNLLFPMLFLCLPLLLIYYLLDRRFYLNERKQNIPLQKEPFHIDGLYNLFLIFLIIAVLLFSGKANLPKVNFLGIDLSLNSLIRDLLLLGILAISHFITPYEIKAKNEFSWYPIKEVIIIFFGLFITMIPAVQILLSGEKGAFGPLIHGMDKPYHYFYGAGVFSAFLDNAPTYLTFLSALLGKFYQGLPEGTALSLLIKEHPKYLLAISCGAVFWGAMTYIGNAPNFMVKSIAEERGIPMPSFFGYVFKYSLPILFPLFVLLSLIYFKS